MTAEESGIKAAIRRLLDRAGDLSPESQHALVAAAEAIRKPSKAGALADVIAERGRQDEKFGEQNHDPIVYLAILTEEVGELEQAALQARFEGGDPGRMREEAVLVAAVALAIVECLDRAKWGWPRDR